MQQAYVPNNENDMLVLHVNSMVYSKWYFDCSYIQTVNLYLIFYCFSVYFIMYSLQIYLCNHTVH